MNHVTEVIDEEFPIDQQLVSSIVPVPQWERAAMLTRLALVKAILAVVPKEIPTGKADQCSSTDSRWTA